MDHDPALLIKRGTRVIFRHPLASYGICSGIAIYDQMHSMAAITVAMDEKYEGQIFAPFTSEIIAFSRQV